MSKSRGTGISPLRYLELGMNAEWLRYYIAAKLNARVEDIDFNPEDFVARVNSRPGRQVRQHRQPRRRLPDQALRRPAVGRRRRRGPRAARGLRARSADRRSDCTTSASSARRCARSWLLADRVNEYVDQHKPWELAKQRRRRSAARRVHRVHRGLPAADDLPRSRCCRRWPAQVEAFLRIGRSTSPTPSAARRATRSAPTST